jgi:GH18 family chitinase
VSFVSILGACRLQPTNLITPFTSVSSEQSTPFRVVGYVTAAAVIETLPFDKLTHINYAFLIPRDDGSLLPIPNAWKLDNLVELAHENGVKVLISVGGWGYDSEFETLASDPISREVFTEKLVAFIGEHELDGIDIDWEYPKQDSKGNFLALLENIQSALPSGKLLTAAVVAAGENANGIPPEAFSFLDFVNVMIYDGPQHAAIDYAHSSLDYWEDRGLSIDKTVMGVPFYSQPFFAPYRKIIESDPSAAYRDNSNYHGTDISYNGIPSMIEKTHIAMDRASGIMIWTLEYDSFDEGTSLLHAIHQTINP